MQCVVIGISALFFTDELVRSVVHRTPIFRMVTPSPTVRGTPLPPSAGACGPERRHLPLASDRNSVVRNKGEPNVRTLVSLVQISCIDVPYGVGYVYLHCIVLTACIQ